MRCESLSARGLVSRRHLLSVLGGTVPGFALLSAVQPLQAGVIPATELTQILNNFQLVASYIAQAAQLSTMLRNLVHNGIHSLSDFSTFLTNASAVSQGGLALAYSTAKLDLAFQKQYPGYATFDQDHPWARNYLDWAQSHRDTLSGTMRMLNLTGADLQSSQRLTAAIRTHAAGAGGAQQILETLSEFSSAQVNELQGLRSLMLSDQQSKSSYMAMEQQQKDTQAAARDKFFHSGPPDAKDTRTYDPVKGVY